MARGAAPGERRGGRAKGTPNKATIERAVRAEADVIKHEVSGKKLAKDVLEDFMFLFAGMAAAYQPLPPGAAVPAGREPNEGKFEKWATLAVKTAADLAKYQSPTFRAHAVTTTMPAPLPKDVHGKIIEGTVIKLDQIAISKVYRQIVAGDGK